MSTAPDSLRAIRQLVSAKAPTWIVSIRANLRPGDRYAGYHAGYDEIYGPNGLGDQAYSVRRPRDRRSRNLNHVPPLASSNASSACDISVRGLGRRENARLQREFTAWTVQRAKAKLLDIQFVGGPDAKGNATIWEKPYWTPKPGVDKDHTHISWPRDTEFGDRAGQLAPYWE